MIATKAPSSPRQPKSKPKVFLRFKTQKKKLLFFSAPSLSLRLSVEQVLTESHGVGEKVKIFF